MARLIVDSPPAASSIVVGGLLLAPRPTLSPPIRAAVAPHKPLAIPVI